MLLTNDDRGAISDLAHKAMPTIEQIIRIYARAIGSPERFALGIYDAGDLGSDYAAVANIEGRTIAEFTFGEEVWGERNYLETAQSKAKVALRTGRNSGDVARDFPELLLPGEPRLAGGFLAELKGKPIVLGTSGLRQHEDEALGRLLVECMRRLGGEAPGSGAQAR
jgi:hypothetical protein